MQILAISKPRNDERIPASPQASPTARPDLFDRLGWTLTLLTVGSQTLLTR